MENKDLESLRPMILRANRALGTALVEHKLVSPAQLDGANGRLMELLKNAELKQASLLNLLLMNNDALAEANIINYQVEVHELGMIDLHNYNLERAYDTTADLGACWVTRTIPYDKQEDFVMLASNFYLSEPVRKYWEDVYKDKRILWSVATVAGMSESLERVESKLKKSPTT